MKLDMYTARKEAGETQNHLYYNDALKTLKLGRWLLKKGYAYTMQATVVIPYPGTPLFEDCNIGLNSQFILRKLFSLSDMDDIKYSLLTDRTKEIAEKYMDKVFNKGPEKSAQRNVGVGQVRRWI